MDNQLAVEKLSLFGQCTIEHLWDELREKWFHNLTFDSILAVEDRLVDGLLDLENNKQLVHSLTGFDWILAID